MITTFPTGLVGSALGGGFEGWLLAPIGITQLLKWAALKCNEIIMAAKCAGKTNYLALDVSQLALSAVLCVIILIPAGHCLWASWCIHLKKKKKKGRCKVTKANTAL